MSVPFLLRQTFSVQVLSVRALRGSSIIIRKGEPPSKRSNTTLNSNELTRSGDEFTRLPVAEPARYVTVPDRPTPVGLETVDHWKSPLATDSQNIRPKRERYDERFAVAEEINERLEKCANEPLKILEIVQKDQRRFDNMNAFNALGYIHASFNQFERNFGALKDPSSVNTINPILNDSRFLTLCNMLYKKSRSYPPNACIANVNRLLELGVPFRTPLIYMFLSLIKQSINGLTTTEALTLSKSIAPFRSLRLPTALNAGIQALLQKRADDDFDQFAADLGNENVFHQELNIILLMKLFGDRLTPIVRNRLLNHVFTQFIEPGTIYGASLVKFLATLNKEWISSDYIKKCLKKLENNVDDLTVFDAANVTRTCLVFRRFNNQLLLKSLTEVVTKAMNQQQQVINEDVLNATRLFLYDLSRLHFAAPELFQLLITKQGMSFFSNESDFLEALVIHLYGNNEAISRLVTDPKLKVDWESLDQRSKLISYFLKNCCKVDIPYLPSKFPSTLYQIEEMLITVTNENVFDVTEKLTTLPQLLSFAKLSGLQIGDHDLVVRLYIPAVENDLTTTTSSNTKGKNRKLFIVPVGSSDFYQNRFDVVWTCRLRFFLLQHFLSGSDRAISAVPVNLLRFRTLNSEREKFNYVRECLANNGDRDLVELLQL